MSNALAASIRALIAWPTSAYAADTHTWRFRVFLDETPSGEHRFELRANGPERELRRFE